MRHVAAILAGLVFLARPVLCDEPPKKPAETNQAGREQDEQAIHAATEAFVRAYNAGDTKALAALFTKDAEVVDVDGDRHAGREAIEQLSADTFKESPGVTIAVNRELLRFLTPDVAREEGRTTVTPAKEGAPVSRRYIVLFVKQDGRWLQESVREESVPRVRPHDRLKELEWMIGDWIDEGADSTVRTNCRWSDDGNFLLRGLTMKVRGKDVMTVTQRIGWDPLGKQFKSWEFDSEGGYGEGLWARDGARWIIKHTGVTPDGDTASATHFIVPETPIRVRWQSTDRVAGGEALPEGESYLMVRVPPPPGAPKSEKPAPSPTKEPR